MATNRDPGGINSTMTPLAGDAVFTGASEVVERVASVTVMVYADVASAAQGLSLEFSSDGANWDYKKTTTVHAGISRVEALACAGAFFRVVYTNGAAGQSAFRLYTRHHATTAPLGTRPRPVEIVAPLAAYGEALGVHQTPLIQLQFPYSVNPRQVTALSDGTGSSSVSSSMLSVSTGTTTASVEMLRSVKDAKNHVGQGISKKFDAIFQEGTAATEAIIGIGSEEDGLFFGNNGTDFGVLHRCGGLIEYQTLTISAGAVTANGTITITLDGTATEVEVVQNDSAQAVARAIDAVTFAGWETQAIGTTVVFSSHLAEAKAGAFSFADTDTTGVAASLAETITGVAPTNNWIAQSAWSHDKMDGSGASGMTLDVDTGNVFEIKFQSGFGEMSFYIESDKTGHYVLVHRIDYANANTIPSLQNPTLPLYVAVKNKGTTTDIAIQTSSMDVFTEGKIIENEGLSFAVFGEREGYDFTTETSVLAVLNKPVFQGVESRVDFQPVLLTFSGVGTGGAKFTKLRIWINPILGGDPVFTDFSTATSPIAYDTAGTTVSGGFLAAEFSYGASPSPDPLDISRIIKAQPPGTLLVFTVEINSGTADVDIGFNGRDLF